MAKLFPGYDQVFFEHSSELYKAVLTKIILDDKTIYRIDYTSQKDLHTRRIELSRHHSFSEQNWEITPTDADSDLVQILLRHIETNSEITDRE